MSSWFSFIVWCDQSKIWCEVKGYWEVGKLSHAFQTIWVSYFCVYIVILVEFLVCFIASNLTFNELFLHDKPLVYQVLKGCRKKYLVSEIVFCHNRRELIFNFWIIFALNLGSSNLNMVKITKIKLW